MLARAHRSATLLLALLLIAALSTLPTAYAIQLPPERAASAEPAVTQLSVGIMMNCALLDDNTARCWGQNINGGLGDGTTTDSSIPVVVGGSTPITNIVQISVGGYHTCVLLADTSARCWGNNVFGQLGNGGDTNSLTPVVVGGGTPLTNIAALSTGFGYTCARLIDTSARCWGSNFYGQLGDGTTTNSSLPVVVGGGTPITGMSAIHTGWNHTCARMSDATARCWGWNNRGQLGNGTTTDSPTPVAVGGSEPITQIVDLGIHRDHSCLVSADSTAACWGNNESGQLGDDTTTDRSLPVIVGGVETLVQLTDVEVGNAHSCARHEDGRISCWGSNTSGQLGDGTTTDSPIPVAVGGLTTLTGATQLGSGAIHSCALLEGDVICWGNNAAGQLGDATFTSSSVPVPVEFGPVPAISATGASLPENVAGADGLPFTLTLSEASAVTVTVRYSASPITAFPFEDFTMETGTITFTPGVTTQVLLIEVFSDSKVEQDETLRLDLTYPSKATLRTPSTLGTILNDDRRLFVFMPHLRR